MLKNILTSRHYAAVKYVAWDLLEITFWDNSQSTTTADRLTASLPTLHPDDRALAVIALSLYKQANEDLAIAEKLSTAQALAEHAEIEKAKAVAAQTFLRRPNREKHGDSTTSRYTGFSIADDSGTDMPAIRLHLRETDHVLMTERELIDRRDQYPHARHLSDRQIMHDALIALRLYKAENGFPVERLYSPRENFIRAAQEKSGDPHFRDFTIQKENGALCAVFRVHPHLKDVYTRTAPDGSRTPCMTDIFTMSALVARQRRLKKWGEPHALTERAIAEILGPGPRDTGGYVTIQ